MKFVLSRLLIVLPTLFGVITLIFILIRLIPGDPAMAILGEHANREMVEQLRHELGLDKSIYIQYFDFLGNLIKLDFGRSLKTQAPVIEEISRQFPYTVDLVVASVMLSILFGIPMGTVSAVYRERWLDHITRPISMGLVSTPVFYVGLLLLILFSYKLELFPLIGGGDYSNLSSRLYHLVLPAISLSTIQTGVVIRTTRSCLLEVLGQDYIRTARAKGIREYEVILVHGLKNALIPVATVIGLNTGRLLGGAVLTETVFSRPGMGKLLVDSILSHDYPQTEAAVIVFAIGVILVNLITDIVYLTLDPRIRQI